MKIIINFEKKHLYLLLALLIITGATFVLAGMNEWASAGSPPSHDTLWTRYIKGRDVDTITVYDSLNVEKTVIGRPFKFNLNGIARPSCDGSTEGMLWYEAPGRINPSDSVVSELQICVHPNDAFENYYWVSINNLEDDLRGTLCGLRTGTGTSCDGSACLSFGCNGYYLGSSSAYPGSICPVGYTLKSLFSVLDNSYTSKEYFSCVKD